MHNKYILCVPFICEILRLVCVPFICYHVFTIKQTKTEGEKKMLFKSTESAANAMRILLVICTALYLLTPILY